MQSSPRFEGVYANLPTPFTDDGNSLDLYRLHALIDFLLDRRIDGVACLLSSGEYPYLCHSERLELAAEVVRYVSGRGAGSCQGLLPDHGRGDHLRGSCRGDRSCSCYGHANAVLAPQA